MSTGCECQFFSDLEGTWWYILENYNAPKNAWDWRENSTMYGPFKSFEHAEKHLDRNHANPGGYLVMEHVDLEADQVLKELKKSMRQYNKV